MPGRYTGGLKTEKQPAFAVYLKKKTERERILEISALFVVCLKLGVNLQKSVFCRRMTY